MLKLINPAHTPHRDWPECFPLPKLYADSTTGTNVFRFHLQNHQILTIHVDMNMTLDRNFWDNVETKLFDAETLPHPRIMPPEGEPA